VISDLLVSNAPTDYKNRTHQLTQFQTQRVLQWCLLLEDFGATFHYKKGPDNVIADAMSQVPRSSYPLVGESVNGKYLDKYLFDDDKIQVSSRIDHMQEALIEDQLQECLLYHPMLDDKGRLPFSFPDICTCQQEDKVLMEVVNDQNNKEY